MPRTFDEALQTTLLQDLQVFPAKRLPFVLGFWLSFFQTFFARKWRFVWIYRNGASFHSTSLKEISDRKNYQDSRIVAPMASCDVLPLSPIYSYS